MTPRGPSVENPSPKLLAELLNDLDRAVLKAGVPAEALRPGLDPVVISQRLEAVDLPPHPEVVTWFSWHDGATRDLEGRYRGQPLPDLPMATLDSAINSYQSRQSLLEKGPIMQEFHWGRDTGWLPLVDGNHGLAVECNGAPVEPAGIHYATSEFTITESVWRAVSLCTYATWLLYAFENGAYVYYPKTSLWGLSADPGKLHPTQATALFY